MLDRLPASLHHQQRERIALAARAAGHLPHDDQHDRQLECRGPQALRCSCACARKETPYRREGKSWAGSEISPGAGGSRLGQFFAFTKLAVVTCPVGLSTASVSPIKLFLQTAS